LERLRDLDVVLKKGENAKPLVHVLREKEKGLSMEDKTDKGGGNGFHKKIVKTPSRRDKGVLVGFATRGDCQQCESKRIFKERDGMRTGQKIRGMLCEEFPFLTDFAWGNKRNQRKRQ